MIDSQTQVIILAFSRVSNTVLHKRPYTLSCYAVRDEALVWMKNFLSSRQHSVVFDGTALGKANVISCVPQGTVLGPLLFLDYVNDLPNNLKSTIY